MSPTQRTLAHLRKNGWLCGIVEKWNPHARIRQDLFGFADVVGVLGNCVTLIQTTSGSNMSARITKIRDNPNSKVWLASCNRSIFVHGWAKRGARGKRKTWTLREVEIRL